MSVLAFSVEQFLKTQDIGSERLSRTEHREVERRWFRVFAQNVKDKTGSYICDGFRWHGFSGGFERAIKGARAMTAYQSARRAPYVVFDENGTCCFRCSSNFYPDFSPLDDDIYVAHHNMEWTMAFTHEQPYFGPYFCSA